MLDHEVREHGVRVLHVQPGPINIQFDANMVRADTPLPVYAQRRCVFDDVVAESIRDGDNPAVVGRLPRRGDLVPDGHARQ